MSETSQVALLEADIGCIRYAGTLDFNVMLRLLTESLANLTLAVERGCGTVLKSGGAEFGNVSAWLTATLPSADAAADAAAEYLRLCPGMNSAECGPPEVSVAFNFGDVIISDGEYFGPAFSVLGTLMHHTRSGQILTSASTVEHLAPERRSAIHPLKSVETKHGRIELCELDWRK